MDIVTRSQWGARAPRSVTRVTWGSRTGITVHHSAGPAGQSIRAIQNYHMDSNGWSDIGYNHLISGGRVYEGRGWLVHGAHDSVNSNVGVCLVGNFQDRLPSNADLAALRWYIAETRRRSGRNLRVVGHRDVPGNSTACPGNKLHAWLRAGEYEEDDMQLSDTMAISKWLHDLWPGIGGRDKRMNVGTALVSGYGHSREGKDIVKRGVPAILAGQAAILAAVGGADVEQIQAAVRAELETAADRERAERAAELENLVEPLAAAIAPLLDHDLDTAAVEAALRSVFGGLDAPGEG